VAVAQRRRFGPGDRQPRRCDREGVHQGSRATVADEDLRSEAYLHALRPGVILDTGPRGGRYQGIRVAVEPHGMRSQAVAARGPRAVRLADAVEAMPIAF
jgi:hypothetical protein